jgi:hypothetical protein
VKAIALVSALWCATAFASADDAYFPIRTKPGGEGVTEPESQWHGKSLQRMNEPRLPDLVKDVNAEVYRIMILPTWRNSIVVRAQRHGDVYSLLARRLDGQAGYDPGKLVEAKDIELSADDSKALEVLIQNLNFFQLPTDDCVLGLDGDEWILEGISQGKYHFVRRWCASSYNPDKRGLAALLRCPNFWSISPCCQTDRKIRATNLSERCLIKSRLTRSDVENSSANRTSSDQAQVSPHLYGSAAKSLCRTSARLRTSTWAIFPSTTSTSNMPSAASRSRQRWPGP